MRAVRSMILAAVLLSPAAVAAQTFGTFTWQMQPYCNRVTLSFTSTPAGFTVTGLDDGCGAAVRGSAAGSAVFGADGTVGLTFTIVTPPDTQVVRVSARVSPATGQGTWSDDAGHDGAFAFGGSTPGLPPRPSVTLPVAVADNPGEAHDPCNVPTARPVLMLCGNATARWVNGGAGLPGLQIWRDRDGRVHLRGSAYRTNASLTGVLFVLPPHLTPRRTIALTVSTGLNAGVHASGTALLMIFGADLPFSAGLVTVQSAGTPYHSVLHLGELVFTVDR